MTDTLHKWLVAWCWMVIAIGAGFAASALPALRAPTTLFLDLVFWPVDGIPGAAMSPEAVFATSISGALTMGWAVLMLQLLRDPVLAKSASVWRAMTTAVVIWFVIDSLVSWISGARLNVLSNLVLLAGFLVPVQVSGILNGSTPAGRTHGA